MWGLNNIKVQSAWNAGNIGDQNIFIGVIDEGIQYFHEDLCGQVWTNPYDPVDGVDNDGNRQPQSQQIPQENQRTPISDSVLAGAIKKIESRERPLSDLLNFHVFTESQKVVIKKHFPQVQL